jgi:hypothetical protein
VPNIRCQHEACLVFGNLIIYAGRAFSSASFGFRFGIKIRKIMYRYITDLHQKSRLTQGLEFVRLCLVELNNLKFINRII